MCSQQIILTHELIFAPSFEPVTIWPRSSSICSHTYFTGSGHFHGFTRSGPIQVVSALGDCFAAVASKVSRTIQISQRLNALKEFAGLCLALMQQSLILVFDISTWSSQAVSHPSTIQAKWCLTSMLKWELMFPTLNYPHGSESLRAWLN